MRVTILGCGDAFGSGGRFNTCFLVETGGRMIAVDFGASSMVALKQRGIDPNRIDAVVLSHLHGDHFGGLPFLFLDSQFACARRTPLTIIGPVGTSERLKLTMEAFFPGSSTTAWRYPVTVEEQACGAPFSLGALAIERIEVIHPSGAPATALRLWDGSKRFAYSGDTTWTEALVDVARDADLFICECYTFDGSPPYHLAFKTIDANRARLGARTIMLTHMGEDMLAHRHVAAAKGYRLAADGLVIAL
ncbi:MBL fold metallo-hydrolase [Chelatococcus reniformis]|uniref:MBL fold metallo-hydrolase n=1 Tax=Chelatococcus reniformis TaxID=1494448 RepID=A0A916XI24_9HYPH|nr:MBL fold metallo-hydrolase [Chelatococcus reniformis]GGC73267.1 MBL fold metallo-hydrolase [Chelatococcus reniformis]